MGSLAVSVLGVILLVSSPGLAQAQEGWEVSGTVTRGSRPVKGMYVTVRGPSSVPSAVTDSQGGYSIKGLVPGQYVIAMREKEYTIALEPRNLSLSSGMRLKVNFRIAKGSVISGRVLDGERRPVPGLIVQAFGKTVVEGKLRISAQDGDKTNDLGEYRIPYLPEGPYVVAVSSEPLKMRKRAPESSPAPGRGYPSITFYPGTRDVQTADVLELRDGAERTGIDFVLQQGPTRCLSFKVGKGFQGERVAAGVRERLGFEPPTLGSARIAAGESYEVCGLAPGEYNLTVSSMAEGTKAEFPGAIELGRTLQILGYQMITALVGKENVDLGIVEPLAFADVQGTVTVKDARPGDSIPSGVLVRLVASELGTTYTNMRNHAAVEKDGTFVLRQVFAGDYGVRVYPPRGYYLIGIYQQSRSVLDGGFYPGNGDLEVKLGSDGCELTGRVLAEDGAGVPDASVFLVPEDPGSHYVVQTDQTGAYRFAPGIRPGEYRLVAAQDVREWQRTDAGTAARLAEHGRELRLNPRESRIMDVKVQPLP
jgi:hypothetical protein